jgi:hypothetical protein
MVALAAAASSPVSWYMLPSVTARGAMDRRMDGQTESFAAVAAAVLIPLLLLSTLFAVAIGIRDFASFSLSLSSLHLHPLCFSLSPLSVITMSSFNSHAVASRIKRPTTMENLVWSFFVRYDSPAFSRLLELGFSVNPLDPLLDRWGVLFSTKNTT